MLDDEAAFKARVVPIISALFASPDHAIRNTLISNIHECAPPFISFALLITSVGSASMPRCHARGALARTLWRLRSNLESLLSIRTRSTIV